MDNPLDSIKKEEARFLRMESVDWVIKREFSSMTTSIRKKIPLKAEVALMNAFSLSFTVVFESGIAKILTTKKSKQNINDRFLSNERMFDEGFEKWAFSSLEKDNKSLSHLNTALAALEGGTLGLLGIGAADVPLFIAMVLKAVYETATNYGFLYETMEERYYILKLIELALCKPKDKYKLSSELDDISNKIDAGKELLFSLEEQKQKIAMLFTDELILTKFIQGIPVVGIVGAAASLPILSKTSKYAAIKYKKRFILKKQIAKEMVERKNENSNYGN